MEKSIGDIVTTDEIIFAPISKSFQVPVCNKTVVTEISEDLTLPDYLPEIRRLLRVTPSISVPSQYVNGSVAEFSGTVNWNILYVCGDGTLSEASFSSPYEVSADFDESNVDDAIAFIETIPENILGKVTAPRKLNIRGRLSHTVKAYGDRSTTDDSYDTEDATHVKKLSKTVPSLKILSGVDNTLELSESIGLSNGERIVSKRGTVLINQATPSEQGITCQGNVCLSFITETEDKKASVTERNLPFSAYVPIDLEGDAWKCRVYGKIDDIEAEETETGNNIRIRISVAGEAERNQPCQITTDIFSTKHKADTTVDKISLPCSLDIGHFNFVHDGSAEIDGLPEGAEIIDVYTTARAEKLILENEKYILLGKCKYNVLYGSEKEYSVRESEFPFSCELGSGTEAPKDFSADICVRSSKVRPEGENMAFSSELTASVNIIGETPVTAVTDVSFNEDLPTRSSAFTVAYTADGDTLWNIAKRYSVDPTFLAESNGLKKPLRADDAETLSGVKYLII